MHGTSELISGNTLRQFILFTGVGGTGTAAHYLTLIGLVEGGLLPAVPASIAGFTVGAIINYLLNYKYTFNSNAPHKRTVARFLITAVIGALINTLLLHAGVNLIGLYYISAQVIATGIVLLFNFTTNKVWTFCS
jgi:putative flippase GtrA